MNESTLQVSSGASPGKRGGTDDGRAGRSPAVKSGRSSLRATFGRSLRATFGRSLRSTFDDLFGLVFPSDCRVCGGPLLRAGALPICEVCRVAIPAQRTGLCRICGEDMGMESVRFAPAEGLECHECREAPPKFERAVACAVYEGELREMVHLLKYERMRGVAKLLAGEMAQAMLALRSEAGKELLVVPVPLYRAKQRERGYNQAELLAAEAIARLRGIAPEWKLSLSTGTLARLRDTRSQFELNPTGRRRNLAGAFAVDAARFAVGCEVLLVDDIYTTGATARECARVLRRAGAAKVWVVTLARAQSVRVAMWDGAVRAPQGFG